MTTEILHFDEAINPYGCSPHVVEALVAFARSIVDEAFADYTGVTFIPWVAERPNLVVLRTFSKAYGLAGLRVGYAAAHTAVAQRLARFRIPWGVDAMALVAARAVDPARVHAHLGAHGVRVRTRPDMPEYIRVTAMTPHLNQRFVDILSRL